MGILAGVGAKGRSTSTASQVTGNVTTQASGSGFIVAAAWSAAANFSSIADNKGNSANYVQIGAEIAVGAADKARLYYVKNGIGGAGHNWTIALSAAATLTVLAKEVMGAELVNFLDQGSGNADTTSPFTLTAGLLTTRPTELLMAIMFGNTGSNPGTHAESGIGSMTIDSAAEELDGTQFFTGCIATKVVSSTGTYNPSFTESGGTGAAVFLATFRERADGGARTSVFGGQPMIRGPI